MTLGLIDEDEEVAEVADRAYWEQRSTKPVMAMMDDTFGIVRELDPALELKYNKFYVGIAGAVRPTTSNNFFRPRKSALRVEVKLERSDETMATLEQSGLNVRGLPRQLGLDRIGLAKGDVEKHRDVLRDLFAEAYAASA